jgi:hypothetical protein
MIRTKNAAAIKIFRRVEIDIANLLVSTGSALKRRLCRYRRNVIQLLTAVA